MKKLRWILLSTILMLLLSACSQDLQEESIPSPEINAGENKIDTEKTEVCWGLEDCQAKQDEQTKELPTPSEIKKSYEAEDISTIKINFDTEPKPSTINYRVREIDDEYKSIKNNDSIKVPNQNGTYTYDLLVYWNTNKGQTEGEVVYSFQIKK
jgi:hypothetical protein